MQVGDLVLCGSEEHLGVIIGWDEDKDPIVWCIHLQGATPMYEHRVRLADFITTAEEK